MFIMRNVIFKTLILFIPCLISCSKTGKIEKVFFISRHYTISHASLSESDFGETDYIIDITNYGGYTKYTVEKHCDFDSFYYYPSQASTTPVKNYGFEDYVDVDEQSTYFDFHYDGRCEYRISMLNGDVFSKTGTYTKFEGDDVDIKYSDGTKGFAQTRFGLESNGFAKGKITYLRSLITIEIEIDGKKEEKNIYFWFYDSILHDSPWGEK